MRLISGSLILIRLVADDFNLSSEISLYFSSGEFSKISKRPKIREIIATKTISGFFFFIYQKTALETVKCQAKNGAMFISYTRV